MVIEKYSQSGYIYFIQDGEGGNIKIGFSGNPNERIKQLQTGNGKVFIPLLIQEGNERKESQYHEMFKEHHLHGEWFKPHDSILLFINSQKIKGETKLIERLNNIHNRIENLEIEVKELKRKLEEDYVHGDEVNERHDLMLEYCLQIEHKLDELVKENNLKKGNPEKELEEVKRKLQERDEKDLKEGVESEDDKDDFIGKYEGKYKDGLLNGQGTSTNQNGGKYVGENKDGIRNGQGIYTWSNGSKYVGEWKDGEMNGEGTITYPDGNKYVGEFKDGERNGQGIYTWSDGRKYVGEFKDGILNGKGTLTQPDGEKYEGEWKDGERNGQGTDTSSEGEKYVGEFNDGDFWNGIWYGEHGDLIWKFVNGVKQR